MKRSRASDVDDLDAEVVGEGLHHLLGLVQAQQAVVDEQAGELLADGPMKQRRDHRGIDAPDQTQNDFVAADSLDLADRFVDIVGHVPVAAHPHRSRHERLRIFLPCRVWVTTGGTVRP